MGGLNMDARGGQGGITFEAGSDQLDDADREVIKDALEEVEKALDDLTLPGSEVGGPPGSEVTLPGSEAGQPYTGSEAGPSTNVGMRPLTPEEKISYGEVSTLSGSDDDLYGGEGTKSESDQERIERVGAEMYSTETNFQVPEFGDVTLPVAGSEVGPDYQKNQRQMVDQLIMMANSAGEYDQNAMTAQLNKTDLKKLVTAMATKTTLPFTLTKRQQVALQKLFGLAWFQAALRGGNR